MSTSTKPQGEVKRWHVILFDTIAGLLLLLVLFGSGRDLLLLPGQSGFPSIIHRWHEAQSGAFMTILLGGSLLALLWKPQNKTFVNAVYRTQHWHRLPLLRNCYWSRVYAHSIGNWCGVHRHPGRGLSQTSRSAELQK